MVGNIVFPGDTPSLDKGATVNITEMTGSGVGGTATAEVTAAGLAGARAVGTGTFLSSGNPPVNVTFDVTVDLFFSSISGSAAVSAGDLDLDLFFEPPETQFPLFGTYQIRVVSDDFGEFIVGSSLE